MARIKKRNENSEKQFFFSREFYGIILLILAVFLSYFILFPNRSGIVGSFIFDRLIAFLGQPVYMLPIIMFWYSWELFYKEDYRLYKKIFGLLFFFIGFSGFLSALSVALVINNKGGRLGVRASYFLYELLGTAGSYVISIAFLIFALFLITEIPLSSVTYAIRYLFFTTLDFIKISSVKIVDFIQELVVNIKSKIKERKKRKKVVPAKVSQVVKEPPKINISKNNNKQTEKEEIPTPKKRDAIVVRRCEKKEVETAVETLEDTEQENKYRFYKIPDISLLEKPVPSQNTLLKEKDLKENAAILESALLSFGVEAHVSEINTGPVVTSYELMLSPGTKVSNITSLSNDIALALKAPSVRIIAPIPGKSAVGIEIPNLKREPVLLREIITSAKFKKANSRLTIALGKDVSGNAFIKDIESMPHLLVAGSTGSGKSVCINTLIMSILFKATPTEVKFILIDPKRVELTLYKNMPHLYTPVITSPKEAAKILNELVGLMESRYKKFAEETVRNIESYNNKMEKLGREKEFYIVVIIDELADLMMVASRDVENAIVRLSQMARAVGIHLVLATQRPSVDVITGVIKTNLPSRISFQVLSRTDSRVILDSIGAEALLGRGDMLAMSAGDPKPSRVQGCYVSEEEVERVLKNIKAQATPDYSHYTKDIQAKNSGESTNKEEIEALKKALKLAFERKKISYDLLRANGFTGPKASNLISLMEVKEFIIKPSGTNRWSIDFDKIEEFLDEE